MTETCLHGPALAWKARLTAEMRRQGLSVTALAKAAGVRQSTLQSHLGPQAPGSYPPVELCLKLAAALSMSPKYLIFGIE
jgi:lambda repressor-like predicted transcriptional regulator